MIFNRKYNTLLVTGTTAIRIPIVKRGVVDYAVGADWTPTAGDVKISVNGTAPANVTNLPTAVASGNTAYWEFILTAAELSCKQALITISDSATKVIEDDAFIVETFGNASAMYIADFSLANIPANMVQVAGDAQSATDLKDFADTGYDPATHKVQGVVLVDTTTTNTDMRGTNSAALAATALSNVQWTNGRAAALDNLDATISSRGTSTLTQTQVTGGAYSIQSSSCVLGDARLANLDVAVSTRGTSTLTQTQVTGGAYSIQSSSCVLGDARLANLDVAVSTRGTSTLTQSQVTGGAYSIQSASCVLGDARLANLDVAVSTRGTSTLTQSQVTGGAYTMQSASCVLGDARLANLDVAVSTRGTSTLTQSQVTGGAYTIQHASCVLGDARLANLDAAVSSVSAGSAPTVEEIDARLSSTHGATGWGAATLYVTPLTVTVGIGEATSMGNLVAYLHGPMPTIVVTITDALGAPVNLSAADLTVIGRLTSDHTILFVLRQTDDQISVSGAGNNVVTIESGIDYGESAGQWELFLQNQNDSGRMLGVGGLTVFDAPELPA